MTFASGDMKLPGPGFYSITGLAWTGRGRVQSVDISVDGGKTCNPAHIDTVPENIYGAVLLAVDVGWQAGVCKAAALMRPVMYSRRFSN